MYNLVNFVNQTCLHKKIQNNKKNISVKKQTNVPILQEITAVTRLNALNE